MEESRIFLITYFAALLGVVPPGLVNMSVARTCLVYGKKSGIYTALGASLVVLLQAGIGVLLARYIIDFTTFKDTLLTVGLVIFLVLAVYFLLKARQGPRIVSEAEKPGISSLFRGVLIAAINVFPIPFFCALAIALKVAGGAEYDLSLILAFIFAAALGTLTTLYLYVVFIIRLEDRMAAFTKYSNYFMAVLMLVLAIIAAFRIF